MGSGQLCHLNSVKKRQLCMSNEDKEKRNQNSRNNYNKNKEEINKRARMIYQKSKEYKKKCGCL